jgi:hypothetical protein
MRGALVSLAFALTVLIAAQPARAASPPSFSGATIVALQQEPAPDQKPDQKLQQEQAPDQKIDITLAQRPSGGIAWYRNPVWVAIGILAVIVVLLLVVMVAKGNDTTVIRQ